MPVHRSTGANLIAQIPDRATSALRTFPKPGSPGVSRAEVNFVRDGLLKSVVAGIADAERGGRPTVEAEFSFDRPASGKLHYADLVSPEELRAGIGEVVQALLKKGYYNIVFQTDNDCHELVEHSQWSKFVDTVRVSFSRVGEKRFDVDLETSAMLSVERSWHKARYGEQGSRVGGWGENMAVTKWQDFIEGRTKILENSNGMPF